MAERQRGPAGGLRSGALLDQLVVKIDVDLSGFRRGIAEAIAQVRTLRGAIAGQVGGASLGDAMTAALVAPMVVATARIGQMRNELRLLTTEMRNVALLTAGVGAAGANAGSIVPYAAGGAVLDATRRQGRRSNGQFGPMAYRVEGDDLADAARGGMGAGEAAAAGAGAAAAGGGRRRGRIAGWFGRQASNTAGAFESGRANFPGFGAAAENLGASAYGVGRAGRGALGSGLARALGLVGLGSLFSSLVQLAGSLATVIGGTLAGAFSALMTPLGLVVGAVTALTALFVAANWDQFKEFGEWFATRWKEVIESDGWTTMVAGLENLKGAFGELWETIKTAFHDDGNSIGAILRFFGETVIRVVHAVMELLGGLMNTIAELVRMVAALIRGDWADAWAHFGNAVGSAFTAVKDTITALIPEIRAQVDGIANWIEQRFRDMGNAVSNFWSRLTNPGGGSSEPPGQGGTTQGGVLSRGTMPKGFFKGAANDNSLGIVEGDGGPGVPMDDQLERSTRMADAFGAALSRALDAGAQGGMKFKDVLRQLLADLIQMTAQIAIIEPLSRQWGDALRDIFSGGMGGGKGKGSGGGGIWGSILSSIGSMFGGFFADGGTLKPGQWGVVGERGIEIVRGGMHGATITPVGAGGGQVIDARAYINAAGADPAAIARLQAALDRRDRELPSRIRAELGEVRQRRGQTW